MGRSNHKRETCRNNKDIQPKREWTKTRKRWRTIQRIMLNQSRSPSRHPLHPRTQPRHHPILCPHNSATNCEKILEKITLHNLKLTTHVLKHMETWRDSNSLHRFNYRTYHSHRSRRMGQVELPHSPRSTTLPGHDNHGIPGSGQVHDRQRALYHRGTTTKSANPTRRHKPHTKTGLSTRFTSIFEKTPTTRTRHTHFLAISTKDSEITSTAQHN